MSSRQFFYFQGTFDPAGLKIAQKNCLMSRLARHFKLGQAEQFKKQ